jgi:hypothetical protein
MLSNNMRSRLINIPRLRKVGDGLSKLQGQKPICQSEIESLRYIHEFANKQFWGHNKEMLRHTSEPLGETTRRSNTDLGRMSTTWQRTTMAKRRRLRESILVGRSNKGIHVWVQDNHGIREYLRVQARAYISSKDVVHKHSKQATTATSLGS